MTPSDWIAIVGIAGGLIAFGAGLWQYRRAQQWKRAEFVAEQMKSFESNLKIRLALQMLDWNSRTYELATGEAGATTDTIIDDELLASALVHHTTRPDGFRPPETQIRDCFDALFAHLERFEHYIQTGLVTPGDIRPYLEYWLDILGNRESGRKPEAFYDSLRSYLCGYGYDGVQQLLDQFNAKTMSTTANRGK